MIILKNKIKQFKKEYENENYEKALDILNQVLADGNHDYLIIYKAQCLMKLKSYSEALIIINSLIEKRPYEDLLWLDKIVCHLCLNDDSEALNALGELERVVDRKNKLKLLCISKFYMQLGRYDDALRFCDYALEIDGNFRDALHTKSHILMLTDDKENLEEVLNKLFELSDKGILSVTPLFLLKLFSKRYRESRDLLNNSLEGDVDEEYVDLLKSVIYKTICEDLDVHIALEKPVDLDIDVVLELMFIFDERHIDRGIVDGVRYRIM